VSFSLLDGRKLRRVITVSECSSAGAAEIYLAQNFMLGMLWV
jgi:hypothetical protein